MTTPWQVFEQEPTMTDPLIAGVQVALTKRGKLFARDHDRLLKMARDHHLAGRISRRVGASEMGDVIKAIHAEPRARRVRVYSEGGFVPNSYRYRAPMEWVEAVKVGTSPAGTPVWQVKLGTGDAKRPSGQATRVVVERAAVAG